MDDYAECSTEYHNEYLPKISQIVEDEEIEERLEIRHSL